LKSADGATAVEYGVQLAAVVIAVVLGANMLGVNMSATFTKVDDALGNAMDRKSTVTTTTLSGSSR
jgi:Flp pilus assembly pilin Flp